ncbi:MAG: hypothetical protein DCF32_09540 [Leptolyngbya sp.]|nr:MAG: hypothetical protein DCF32_09540 [Leptolyngbya sp.]
MTVGFTAIRNALKKKIVKAVQESVALLDDMHLAEAVGERRPSMGSKQIISPVFSGAMEDLISDGVLKRSRQAGAGREVVILGTVPDSFLDGERVIQAGHEPPMLVKIDKSVVDPGLKRSAVRAAAAKTPGGGKREIVKINVPQSLIPARPYSTPAPEPEPVAAVAAAIAAPVATAVVPSTSDQPKRGRSYAQMVTDLNTAWNRRIGLGHEFTLLKLTTAANAPATGGNGYRQLYRALTTAIEEMAAAGWNTEAMKGYLDLPRKFVMGQVSSDSSTEEGRDRRTQEEVTAALIEAWQTIIDRGESFCRSEIMRAARYRHRSHSLMTAMDIAIAAMKAENWSAEVMAEYRDLKSVMSASDMKALKAEVEALREQVALLQAAQVMPSAVELLEAEVVAFDGAIAADPDSQALRRFLEKKIPALSGDCSHCRVGTAHH